MTNVYGGAGPGDWCTPKWIADLLGRFDLDPCSNPRSHIQADHLVSLETGGNGLAEEGKLPGAYFTRERGLRTTGLTHDVFINPEYGRGQVIRWVRHWRLTRFTFLLKWAPDTQWFRELIPHCTHVWHPLERIEFEPPPGTSASSNPFPHALYMREPPTERLKRLATRGLVSEVQPWLDVWLSGAHAATHERSNVSAGDGSEQGAGAARGGGGGKAAGAPRLVVGGTCTSCHRSLTHHSQCPVFPIG